MSIHRHRVSIFICALTVLNSALLFAVAADAPFVLAATVVILAYALLTSKSLPRTSRSYIYLGTGVAMLTVLGNQVFEINDDRFFLLPVEIYGPGLLYFAAALTLFDQRETTITAIVASAIVTLMLSGNMLVGDDMNSAMPFSNGLLRHFAQFYTGAVVLGVLLSVWLLHYFHRRTLHRPVGNPGGHSRRAWLIVSILLVGGFVLAGREMTRRNEAAIRRLFYSFMGDFFRFSRGGYFGDRTNLRGASRLRSKDFDRVVLRAVGGDAPGYLRARSYTEYDNGSWRVTETPRRRLTEFMDDPTVAVVNFRLPEAIMDTGGATNRYDFSVYVADNSIRRHLPVSGNFRGIAAVADVVEVDLDGTLLVDDWERSGGYSVERLAGQFDSAFPAPLPAEMDEDIYLQLPEDFAAAFSAQAQRVLDSTGDPENPEEIVREVIAYFNRNYEYELGASLPPGDDPVLAFLEDGDRGHCELFAAGTVLLLRSVGIPARYVVGFVCVEPSPGERYWLARRGDAHAWAEAFIPGRGGWVVVESTPASGVPDATAGFSVIGAWLDRLTLAWQEFFAGVKRGYVAREILRVFRGILTGIWRVIFHPLGGSLAILVLAGVLYRTRRNRLIHAAGLSVSPELVRLRKNIKAVEKRLTKKTGHQRPASMTLDEFAQKFRNDEDPEICELRNVFEFYAHLRYSGAWRDSAVKP